MSAASDILDELRAFLGASSDAQIATRFQLTRSSVSNWRVGKGTLSDETALMVAELLGKDPRWMLAVFAAERTRNKAVREVYLQMAEAIKKS